MNIKKRYFVVLIVFSMIIGASASYIGVQVAQPNVDQPQVAEKEPEQEPEDSPSKENPLEDLGQIQELSKVSQAYSMIQNNYVHEVDKKQLVEGAIQGMLKTLDDPYSVYMDKETVEQFNHSIESSFEGIGAEVSMVNGKVTIVSPFKDSPAKKSGLKPNDQIISVDGQSLEGLDLYEAVLKIRGEKGTTVTLEVDRPNTSENLMIDVTRDNIPIETVYSKTEEVKGKKTGIIEITSFSEQTAKRFNEELQKLEEQSIEGLVIDVRGNPGGLFTAVQDILKNFIPKDQPYVQIEDRNGEKTRYFSKLESKKEYPITVLINGGSASASEILAGTMKEAGGYDLVGEKTFGKGTVQQAIPLGDGSTMKMTLYKWLTPEGNWIHKKGIKPTIEVKQPTYFYANPIQLDDQPLAYDQTDEKVENVQVILNGLGYDPGREDGYYSKGTEKAVKAFQQDKGLEATGAVNEETAKKLEETIIQQVQKPENDKQMDKALNILYK